MKDFWLWWQYLPQKLSPYLLKTEYFSLHYYGLMYVVAFSAIFALLVYRVKTENYDYDIETLLDFLIWAILGTIIGGRLGYVIFYNPIYYLSAPLEIISPFKMTEEGIKLVGIKGMSYHGGLIGVITSTYLFTKKKKVDFWKFADFLVPTIPLGYMFGRIGNFINGELVGRITNKPWGVYFSKTANQLRHPSQIYEAATEGLVLFMILWYLRKRDIFDGWLVCLYIFGYGIARFTVEYFRRPDPHLGFIFFGLTMGQFLSILMLIGGVTLYYDLKDK